MDMRSIFTIAKESLHKSITETEQAIAQHESARDMGLPYHSKRRTPMTRQREIDGLIQDHARHGELFAKVCERLETFNDLIVSAAAANFKQV